MSKETAAKLDRYAAMRAKSRVMSYYFPSPQEVALKKNAEPFERAKKEWLMYARMAIAEVEQMDLENFQSVREEHTARRPNECGECGHIPDSTSNLELFEQPNSKAAAYEPQCQN